MQDKIGGHANRSNVDTTAISWARDTFNVKSIIDVGAGLGQQVYTAKKLGFDAIGIEGDPNVINEHTILHDFRDGPYHLKKIYDLAFSCEFLEHVQEKYMSNYMSIFANCRYAMITAAPPNWGGYGHVNEQPTEYWIEKFAEYNIIFNEEFTDKIRAITDMGDNAVSQRRPIKRFLKNRGLFFINKGIE